MRKILSTIIGLIGIVAAIGVFMLPLHHLLYRNRDFNTEYWLLSIVVALGLWTTRSIWYKD